MFPPEMRRCFRRRSGLFVRVLVLVLVLVEVLVLVLVESSLLNFSGV